MQSSSCPPSPHLKGSIWDITFNLSNHYLMTKMTSKIHTNRRISFFYSKLHIYVYEYVACWLSGTSSELALDSCVIKKKKKLYFYSIFLNFCSWPIGIFLKLANLKYAKRITSQAIIFLAFERLKNFILAHSNYMCYISS